MMSDRQQKSVTLKEIETNFLCIIIEIWLLNLSFMRRQSRRAMWREKSKGPAGEREEWGNREVEAIKEDRKGRKMMKRERKRDN